MLDIFTLNIPFSFYVLPSSWSYGLPQLRQVRSSAEKYGMYSTVWPLGISLWMCSGHDRLGNTTGQIQGTLQGLHLPSGQRAHAVTPVGGNCFGNDVWAALLDVSATVANNKYSTWIIRCKSKSLTTAFRMSNYTFIGIILTLVYTHALIANYQ